MISREFRQGFFLVWAVLSIAALFMLVLPLCLPENVLFKFTPVCQSKKLGLGECPLCGMTSAFVEISKGDLKGALYSNRASVAVYSFLVLNELIFLGKFALGKYGFRKNSKKLKNY